MENKNKDILKKGIMETKPDFTSSLMNKINAEEEALITVLSEQSAMQPSANFTANLMTELEGKVPLKTYAPIISKRAWIFISAACIALTVFVFSTANQNSSHAYDYLNSIDLSEKISSVFNRGYWLLYIGFGVLVLSIGLTIEQRFGKKTTP